MIRLFSADEMIIIIINRDLVKEIYRDSKKGARERDSMKNLTHESEGLYRVKELSLKKTLRRSRSNNHEP